MITQQRLALVPFVKIYVPLLIGVVLGLNLTLTLSQLMIIPLIGALIIFFVKHSLKKSATYFALFTLGCALPYLQYKEPFATNIDREEKMVVKRLTSNGQIFICGNDSIDENFFVVWNSKDAAIAVGDTLIATVQFEKTESAHHTIKNLDKKILLSAKVIGKSWDGSKYNDNHTHILKYGGDSLPMPDKEPFYVSVRNWSKARLAQLNIESEDIEVINGMLLGDRSNISRERREMFGDSGISHLLAISGMHIGIIFVILNLLFVWRRNIFSTRVIGSVAIIALIWTFTLIVGSPVSAVRASVMFTILQVATVKIFSPYQIYNTLFATATLMTLCNHSVVLDIGFQLSFVSLLSILLFLPYIERMMAKRHKIIKFVVVYVGITVASQVLTLPLTLYYFGYFPVVLIPANMVGILAIYMIISFSILYIIYPNFIFESVISFTFMALNSTLKFLLSLPYSVVEDISFSVTDIILYYSLLYFAHSLYCSDFKRA